MRFRIYAGVLCGIGLGIVVAVHQYDGPASFILLWHVFFIAAIIWKTLS